MKFRKDVAISVDVSALQTITSRIQLSMHIAHGTNVHGFIPNNITANQSILLSRFFQEKNISLFLTDVKCKICWHFVASVT